MGRKFTHPRDHTLADPCSPPNTAQWKGPALPRRELQTSLVLPNSQDLRQTHDDFEQLCSRSFLDPGKDHGGLEFPSSITHQSGHGCRSVFVPPLLSPQLNHLTDGAITSIVWNGVSEERRGEGVVVALTFKTWIKGPSGIGYLISHFKHFSLSKQ